MARAGAKFLSPWQRENRERNPPSQRAQETEAHEIPCRSHVHRVRGGTRKGPAGWCINLHKMAMGEEGIETHPERALFNQPRKSRVTAVSTRSQRIARVPHNPLCSEPPENRELTFPACEYQGSGLRILHRTYYRASGSLSRVIKERKISSFTTLRTQRVLEGEERESREESETTTCLLTGGPRRAGREKAEKRRKSSGREGGSEEGEGISSPCFRTRAAREPCNKTNAFTRGMVHRSDTIGAKPQGGV